MAIFRPTKWLRKEYHGFKVITCVPEDEAQVEAVNTIRRLMDTGGETRSKQHNRELK